MKNILTALLILVLLPCCKKESDSEGSQNIDLNVDHALRSFPYVKTLTGVIRIPKGQASYVITILEFEEGKLARRGTVLEGIGQYASTRVMSVFA